MSFVCNLCGEWSKYTGEKLTIHPNLNSRQRETATVCDQCFEALALCGESDQCAWCGSEAVFTVWDYGTAPMGHRPVGRPKFSLCPECWAKARGEYTPEFDEELKKRVREEHDLRCADCGMDQEAHREEFDQALHIHHKDGDKSNNNLSNLSALCARCHGSK